MLKLVNIIKRYYISSEKKFGSIWKIVFVFKNSLFKFNEEQKTTTLTTPHMLGFC